MTGVTININIYNGVPAMGIQDLTSAVERNSTVVSSAVELIQGLVREIREAAQGDNTDQVRRLAQELEANTDRLASALVQNTDAEDEADDASEDENGEADEVAETVEETSPVNGEDEASPNP
jgi:methyl-accepting chemotaxis protein